MRHTNRYKLRLSERGKGLVLAAVFCLASWALIVTWGGRLLRPYL